MDNIRMRRSIENALWWLAVVLVLMFFLFPIYFICVTSIKKPLEAFVLPPKWVFEPVLTNYKEILFGGGFRRVAGGEFMRQTLNSVIITGGTTALVMAVGIPAAYSFARFRFRGKELLSFWILMLLMVPAIVFVIPLRLFATKFAFYDTHFFLVLVYTIFDLPFFIWMARGFFHEIPKEIEECALIDGCSGLQALIRIAIPLASPGLAAAAILIAIFAWNEFLFALILTGKVATTAPVGITAFIALEEIQWGKICAGGVIITFAPMLFAFLAQRYIVRGLTFGAVKG